MLWKIQTNSSKKYKQNYKKKIGEISSKKHPKNVKFNGPTMTKILKMTKHLKNFGNKLKVIKLSKKSKRKKQNKFKRKRRMYKLINKTIKYVQIKVIWK